MAPLTWRTWVRLDTACPGPQPTSPEIGYLARASHPCCLRVVSAQNCGFVLVPRRIG